jgi:DNA polymerase-1
MPTSTAANINKMALARLHKALPLDCRLLLTAHDSVLIEVPKDQTQMVGRLVKRTMEGKPAGFSVPLVVDIKCGRSWGQCK